MNFTPGTVNKGGHNPPLDPNDKRRPPAPGGSGSKRNLLREWVQNSLDRIYGFKNDAIRDQDNEMEIWYGGMMTAYRNVLRQIDGKVA